MPVGAYYYPCYGSGSYTLPSNPLLWPEPILIFQGSQADCDLLIDGQGGNVNITSPSGDDVTTGIPMPVDTPQPPTGISGWLVRNTAQFIILYADDADRGVLLHYEDPDDGGGAPS